MKKLFIILVLSLLFLPRPSLAQEQVNIYFFYGDGCPHCSNEEEFFEELLQKEIYKDKIEIQKFEVWSNPTNAKLIAKVGTGLGVTVSGIPMVVVGNKAVIGFASEQTTGREIIQIIDEALEYNCSDYVARIISGETNLEPILCEKEIDKNSVISVPVLGEIDTNNLSLPLLTIIIAGLDGFNPCAMWILLFLISLLLNMKNRRRMWILGISFIVVSAAVYYLFLAAWLNLFLFLGFLFWVRLVIAAVALFSGGYHLREYFVNRDATCKVTGNEKRKKTFRALRKIIDQDKFWLALGGIVLLAAAVNLVELICSAGLPAVYTHVLSLSGLSSLQYYSYLFLYVFIFMLDDLLIFVIAMTSLKMSKVNTQYSRLAGLIGGIIMLIIGVLLIFQPGWLAFG